MHGQPIHRRGVVEREAGLYFIGFERPQGLPTPSLKESPAAVAQFLSLGFGLIRTDWWEHWAIATLLLLGVGVWLLLRAIWSNSGERTRASGLLLFYAAMGSMALAVGWVAAVTRAGTCPSAPWDCTPGT